MTRDYIRSLYFLLKCIVSKNVIQLKFFFGVIQLKRDLLVYSTAGSYWPQPTFHITRALVALISGYFSTRSRSKTLVRSVCWTLATHRDACQS